MDRFVVISGCSGGGKSTLLAESGRRGYAVVEEPGRRIVQNQAISDFRLVLLFAAPCRHKGKKRATRNLFKPRKIEDEC